MKKVFVLKMNPVAFLKLFTRGASTHHGGSWARTEALREFQGWRSHAASYKGSFEHACTMTIGCVLPKYIDGLGSEKRICFGITKKT